MRPYRSVLYMPASRARALEKARGLGCDALIFDLEDAVAPDEKHSARDNLARALAEGGYGARARLVRINALDTPWGADDVCALAGLECDGILLPKVAGPADLDRLADLVPQPLWAMIETPQGVLNAAAICGHPRLAGVVFGGNDLARDLRARPDADRTALHYALGATVLAVRASGRIAIDGVYNAFRDAEGLARECRQGRDFGFDGKSLIHPDQIAIANAAFAPSEAELDLARRQIAAHAAVVAQGQGVAVVDGQIVEALHVATARDLIDMAGAIAARAGDLGEAGPPG